MSEKSTLQKRIEKLESYPDDTLFYWASYGYVGNSPNFWALNSRGYTSDIDKAQLYTKAETLSQLECDRDQDRFYVKEDVEKAIYKTVDSQLIKDRI